MAQEYLEKLQAMLAPVAAALPRGVELEVKHFFGGAAAYAQGRICISLTPVGLAMKLSEADRRRLTKQGATPLRYFPKGPVKQDYVVVPRAIRDNRRRLKTWARRSIEHVLTLPEPKRKPAGKKPKRRGPARQAR